MSSESLSESTVEAVALDWLASLGWAVAHGPDIAEGMPAAERTDYGEVVLRGRLRSALVRLNPDLPADALEDAQRRLTRPSGVTLEARNRDFHRMVVAGVTVEYVDTEGRVRGAQVRVLDFDEPHANDWLAVNQFTVVENRHERRPDIVLFVNGLPLAVVELKNPVDEDATVWSAFQQLQTYKAEIPSLFVFNAALIVSDGLEARIGTLTAGREWCKPWRTISGEALADPSLPQLQVLLEGVFTRRRLLALVRDFIVFEDDGSGDLVKKMAGYHQFHAVQTAVTETLRAAALQQAVADRDPQGRYESGRQPGGARGDRRIGVVWHTQGSGKSLTMAFYAGRIVREPAMENPTIVVLTDRNDLDDQLFTTFSRCADLLRQPPVQAKSRADLRAKLAVEAGGVVFTTIQKFFPEEPSAGEREGITPRTKRKGDRHPLLSNRRNIVVIADEAHRSQYDFVDGYARHMRDALPSASFIGFTGTPVELADANTRAVFGDHISVYDIQRAVEDGATVPIYYESRLARLALDEREKPTIDAGFEEVTEGEEVDRREEAEDEVGAARSDCRRREARRPRCPRHRRALREPAGGDGRQGDGGLHEPAHLHRPLPRAGAPAPGVARRRQPRRAEGRDDGEGSRPARLAAAHPQQAAARGAGQAVPRPRRSAPDRARPRHVAHRLRRAQPAHDVRRQAHARPRADAGHRAGQPRFPGQARRSRRRLPGPRPRAETRAGHLHRERRHRRDRSRPGAGRRRDAGEVRDLLRPVPRVRPDRMGGGHPRRAARPAAGGPGARPRAGERQGTLPERGAGALAGLRPRRAARRGHPHPRRRRVLPGRARGPVQTRRRRGQDRRGNRPRRAPDRLADRGPGGRPGHLRRRRPRQARRVDPLRGVLAEVRGMQRRNLAVELLQKLLAGELAARRRKNVVQARSFADMLEQTIRRYQNRAIEAAQVIEELIGLARELREAGARGETLGLSDDELAFYDALGVNDSAVQVLGDVTLCGIARELVTTVRGNVTIDWTLRENVRANLRRLVKRILRKHGYPPDKQESATRTVLEQAEVLSAAWAA